MGDRLRIDRTDAELQRRRLDRARAVDRRGADRRRRVEIRGSGEPAEARSPNRSAGRRIPDRPPRPGDPEPRHLHVRKLLRERRTGDHPLPSELLPRPRQPGARRRGDAGRHALPVRGRVDLLPGGAVPVDPDRRRHPGPDRGGPLGADVLRRLPGRAGGRRTAAACRHRLRRRRGGVRIRARSIRSAPCSSTEPSASGCRSGCCSARSSRRVGRTGRPPAGPCSS